MLGGSIQERAGAPETSAPRRFEMRTGQGCVAFERLARWPLAECAGAPTLAPTFKAGDQLTGTLGRSCKGALSTIPFPARLPGDPPPLLRWIHNRGIWPAQRENALRNPFSETRSLAVPRIVLYWNLSALAVLLSRVNRSLCRSHRLSPSKH